MDDEIGFWSDYVADDRQRQREAKEGVVVKPGTWTRVGAVEVLIEPALDGNVRVKTRTAQLSI